MASLQAHLAVWFTKWHVKRRLKGCRDYRTPRAILRPLPYKASASVRITPANMNGIPGEWVESPHSTAPSCSICTGAATSAVPRRRTVPSRSGLHCAVSACSPRTLASPLSADVSSLPTLLIHVGSDDALRDDSTRLAKKARAAGVSIELKSWPVIPHAWQLALLILPEARQSLQESSEFLCNHAAVESSGGSGIGLGQHA